MSLEIEQPPVVGHVTFNLDDTGLYLRGEQHEVEAVVANLLSPSQLQARRSQTAGVAQAVDAAAALATAGAAVAPAEDFLRLTPESLAKIRELGAQYDDAGSLRGYLRSGNRFAGDLKFDQVSFAPEQALALQSAAVSLALRSAIADVKKAVEEVQEGVDELARRARASDLGRVVGLYEHLEAVEASTRSRGRLLQADWDSVSGAGLELRQALTTLRSYAQTTISACDDGAGVPKRARALASFSKKDGIGGTLRLIAVAERALHLWQHLRIEHVRVHDGAHLESALDDAREALRTNQVKDDELLAHSTQKLERLREISPLEIHHVLSIPDLQRHADAALSALEQFATIAHTDLPTLDRHVHRPHLSETRAEVKRHALVAKDGATEVSKIVGRATGLGAKRAVTKATRPIRERRG